MSESTQAYGELYEVIQAAGDTARRIVEVDRPMLATLQLSERAALAGRARETARWHAHLAEVLELER